MRKRLKTIYQKLYAYFGRQHWWPAKTPFEVMVGAILTQNTNWANVEKAIANLEKNNLLTPRRLNGLREKKLALLIRPAGYYNLKARRLKNFLDFFIGAYKGNLKKLSFTKTKKLREELLTVNGIGEETADSILLYALKRPIFVIDAYTKRILKRHKMLSAKADYAQAQNLFMQNLKPQVKLFNEYHALLVRSGKEFCLTNHPRCQACPLKE